MDNNDLHVVYYTGAPDRESLGAGKALIKHPRVLDCLYRQFTRDEMRIWTLAAGYGAAYPTRGSKKKRRRIELPTFEGAES